MLVERHDFAVERRIPCGQLRDGGFDERIICGQVVAFSREDADLRSFLQRDRAIAVKFCLEQPVVAVGQSVHESGCHRIDEARLGTT